MADQPTQPLTEALLNYFDEREMDCLPPVILDLVAERDRLRAELDRARKKIKGLQEECDRYAIRAYERFHGLDQDGRGQADADR